LTRPRVELVTRSGARKALHPEKQANRDCGSECSHSDPHRRPVGTTDRRDWANISRSPTGLRSPWSVDRLDPAREKRPSGDLGRQFAPVRSMVAYARMMSDARLAAPGRKQPLSPSFLSAPIDWPGAGNLPGLCFLRNGAPGLAGQL
jgi:hypothetical protein